MATIDEHRRFYARFVVGSTGKDDQRLVAAFEAVPREDYMGPGPWPIFIGSGYMPTVSDDPRLLYQDVLVGLATDRGINNGQPTLHARCVAEVSPAPGETVLHIGAGTGYYTAVLATLVGPSGRVIAYEIEADLAERARANLAHFPQVRVISASATNVALPQANVIYVSAGATHPPPEWLDALEPGGRLILPLTPGVGYGVMLLVTRCGPARYDAKALLRVAFIPCIGARDERTSASIANALERQSLTAVRSLRRGTEPDKTAWCVGTGWWLSTAPAAPDGPDQP